MHRVFKFCSVRSNIINACLKSMRNVNVSGSDAGLHTKGDVNLSELGISTWNILMVSETRSEIWTCT